MLIVKNNWVKRRITCRYNPTRMETMRLRAKLLRLLRDDQSEVHTTLVEWLNNAKADNFDRYSSHLHSPFR